jgi:hypothetical protein
MGRSVMEARKNQHDAQLENEHTNNLRRAVDQLAIGSIILLWSSLLTLKQIGLIDRNISTWPFALAAFGILLVIGGIYRLSTSRTR